MIPREKSSFLRRSGVRNADANAESTDPPATRRTGTSGPGTVGACDAPVTFFASVAGAQEAQALGRPGHWTDRTTARIGHGRPAAVSGPQGATLTANGPGTHNLARPVRRSVTAWSRFRRPR